MLAELLTLSQFVTVTVKSTDEPEGNRLTSIKRDERFWLLSRASSLDRAEFAPLALQRRVKGLPPVPDIEGPTSREEQLSSFSSVTGKETTGEGLIEASFTDTPPDENRIDEGDALTTP